MRFAFRLGWPVSNAWLLPETPIGPVLVDTGLPALWPAIRVGLRRHGLDPGQLAAVVLTHHHIDHAGNAARLQRAGVSIYAHRLDAQVLRGDRPRPRLTIRANVGGLVCLGENHIALRRCPVEGLDDGDELAGLRVHWVPGHTQGSIFLYEPSSATLLTGDTLLNAVPPTTLFTGLAKPYPAFCQDHPLALRSLRRFARRRLAVRRLLAGHGPARVGRIDRELARLIG